MDNLYLIFNIKSIVDYSVEGKGGIVFSQGAAMYQKEYSLGIYYYKIVVDFSWTKRSDFVGPRGIYGPKWRMT